MIVDDEVLVKVGIKALLKWEEHGYSIVADASDGREALEKIEQYSPHIVLTDLMMEPEDGFWLMEECARRRLHIKFIVLSNYNDFENVKRAMKAGAVDYVFKLTVKPEEMLKALKEAENGQEADASGQDSSSEHIVRKNLDAIKKNLFHRLIHAHTFTSGRVMQELQDILLNVSLKNKYCILYVTLDNLRVARKNGNFTDMGLLGFTLENIVGEVLGKLCPYEVFICEECDLAIVLGYNKDYNEFLAELEQAFERVIKYIRKYYGIGISGAVSDEAVGAGEFKKAVEQSRNGIRQRFFYHTDMLRRCMQVKNILAAEQQEEEKKSREAQEDCHLVMYEIRWQLRELKERGEGDVQQTRQMLRQLYKRLNRCFMKRMVDIEYIVNRDGLNLEEAVNFYDFYEDIERTFLELMEQYERVGSAAGQKPCRREIVEVKNYVNLNIREELSVPGMAAIANMSESRFSHVFKEETGISFVEYVNQVRMDKAETLLKTTDLKINEIGEQIGINNANYFSAQFKRRAGMSPGEFRKIKWAAESERNPAENKR